MHLSRRNRTRKRALVALVPLTVGTVFGCTASPSDPIEARDVPNDDQEVDEEVVPPYSRPTGCIRGFGVRKALPPSCPPIGGAGGMGGELSVR